ncbi:MAG: hypothetical protein AAFV59_05160 [Pseudomonadota bacterium]
MIRIISLLAGTLALGACQHHSPAQPAVLADASAETLDAVKGNLAQAMNRGQIEIGAGDPTTIPSISVLPPPPSTFETQSPAMPTIFKLYVRDGLCFAIAEGTVEEVPLPGVACRPLG